MKKISEIIDTVPGFQAAGAIAGIKKKSGLKDLALIYSETPATAAGVFTKNKVVSPSVTFSRQNLGKAKTIRAILVNSGNANACVGPMGLADCKAIAALLGKELRVSPGEILMASTGVIGVPLPRQKILDALPALTGSLSAFGWDHAAQGIMTTDLTQKTARTEYVFGKNKIVVAGIAKGSGMIHPNMATMLGFVATNAAVTPQALKTALKQAADESFNCITVDGDCSTNDCVIALANGQAGNPPIKAGSRGYAEFAEALKEVCRPLARKIVEDGEGATKFVTVRVAGARSKTDARKVAFSIARSSLVKTAIFGEDPNWGRIFCAVGYSEAKFDPDKVDISLGSLALVKNGVPAAANSPEALRNIMKEKRLLIAVNLKAGKESAEIYTCDLSYNYVKINAEYTT